MSEGASGTLRTLPLFLTHLSLLSVSFRSGPRSEGLGSPVLPPSPLLGTTERLAWGVCGWTSRTLCVVPGHGSQRLSPPDPDRLANVKTVQGSPTPTTSRSVVRRALGRDSVRVTGETRGESHPTRRLVTAPDRSPSPQTRRGRRPTVSFRHLLRSSHTAPGPTECFDGRVPTPSRP